MQRWPSLEHGLTALREIMLAGCLAFHASLGLAATGPVDTADLNFKAKAFHDRRSLNDASVLYRQILAAEPPGEPTSEQVALVLKLTPRFYTTPKEFFPLKDIAAIIHPEKPVIGYHLFWDDDVDFPDDNDPCDHEIVWIEYDPANQRVTEVYTYFHGKILRSEKAAAEANAHGGRAWIGVEWGKHGSLPWDVAAVKSGTPEPLLKANWEKLHTRGTRRPDHPLARGWPREFAGSFDAYRRYSRPVDARARLKQRGLVKVSVWANAVLNQHCLRYNFAPKPEWPWQPE